MVKKNKKGSISDMPFLIAGIFTMAVIAFFVTVVINNLNTEVQGLDIFPDDAKSASSKMTNDFPVVMNTGIVFTFFALAVLSLILASLVAVHPAFIPLYLLEYVFLIWISAGIANTYQAIVEHPLFAVEAGQYSFTIFFFQYFPYAIGVLGAVLAIIIYKVKGNIV